MQPKNCYYCSCGVIKRQVQCLFRDIRGAVALEFALILPVLIAILFGIIQFGLVMFTQQMMVYAAREAARSYAVGTSTAAQAQTLAQGLLPATSTNYTIIVTEPDTSIGETDVTVSISTPMADAAIVNVLGSVMSGNIQAQIVMRVES